MKIDAIAQRQRQLDKRKAAKAGKELIPILLENSAYQSIDEKLKNDPKMAEFVNSI